MVTNYTTVLDEVCDPLTVHKFSEQFSIPRQEAVKIMENYAKEKKNESSFWSLYEVCGLVKSSDNPFLPSLTDCEFLKYVVVPEKELTSIDDQFIKIHSKSLHSVQRTNPKDTRVYGRQWDNNDDLVGVTVPQQKAEKAKEKSSSPEPPAKPTKSTIQPPKKPASVMSMFSKAKPKEVKKEVVAEVKKEKSPTPEKVVKEEPMERSPSPVIVEKKKRKRPIEIDADDSFETKDFPSPVSERSGVDEPVEIEVPKRKKKKNVENDENKSTRKKIIVNSDSDEEIVEEKPKKPTKSPSNDRRRTMKIEKIVETFVDEDGFLVSKEVNKEVELTAEEMKTPEKPKPKITAPAPGAAKVPKKNSTITSFFKKA